MSQTEITKKLLLENKLWCCSSHNYIFKTSGWMSQTGSQMTRLLVFSYESFQMSSVYPAWFMHNISSPSSTPFNRSSANYSSRLILSSGFCHQASGNYEIKCCHVRFSPLDELKSSFSSSVCPYRSCRTGVHVSSHTSVCPDQTVANSAPLLLPHFRLFKVEGRQEIFSLAHK